MLRIFTLLLLLFSFTISVETVYAVGGISNSKIIVPSTETVPKNRIEIEPGFIFIFTDDENDSRNYTFGARFTYGTLDNVEVGASVFYLSIDDSDLINTNATFGNIEPGVKWRLKDQEGKGLFAYSVAYEGGLTLPTTGSDEKWVFEPVGLILTNNISENFSMDKDIVLRIVEDDLWGINAALGLGHYITDTFQPVVEMGYIYNNIDNEKNEHLLIITGGFTWGLTAYATLIMGVSKDIVAENTADAVAISTQLTLLF